MPDIKTLPEDIYALLDSQNDHTPAPENIEWAGELFKDILKQRFRARDEKSGEGVLRFSAIGKPDRQIWYKANKPETAEKMHGKQNFKFLYGDVIEILLLFLAKEAGHSVTHEQYEVEVEGIYGHTDAVIDGVPVDCKSASPYAFQKFKDGSFVFDDPFGYIKQISGYAHALELTDRAAFFVADKVHGDLVVAELSHEDIIGNPPAPRIAQLKEIIKLPKPPRRCYDLVPDGKSGNMKLPVGCSYCEFKEECYKDSNNGQGLKTYIYSRGPVFLAKVLREPKVYQA